MDRTAFAVVLIAVLAVGLTAVSAADEAADPKADAPKMVKPTIISRWHSHSSDHSGYSSNGLKVVLVRPGDPRASGSGIPHRSSSSAWSVSRHRWNPWQGHREPRPFHGDEALWHGMSDSLSNPYSQSVRPRHSASLSYRSPIYDERARRRHARFVLPGRHHHQRRHHRSAPRDYPSHDAGAWMHEREVEESEAATDFDVDAPVAGSHSRSRSFGRAPVIRSAPMINSKIAIAEAEVRALQRQIAALEQGIARAQARRRFHRARHSHIVFDD